MRSSGMEQVGDGADAGLSYYYELFEYALFAELGVLQFICARQRYHIHVLKYVFVFVDCALLAIILSYPNPIDSSSIPPDLAMDSSRFVFFFLLLMPSTLSFRPRLVLWRGYWHCWRPHRDAGLVPQSTGGCSPI